MCARLLSCPLCSQPGFVTLDSLRAGLVSVATRPLACPICNDTLLGIDKLTIHLFGHTINANNNREEINKISDLECNSSKALQNASMLLSQNWNPRSSSSNCLRSEDIDCDNGASQLNSPLSNSNSGLSVTTLALSENIKSQGCGRTAEAAEKRQNQIVFVQTPSMQNLSNGQVYRRSAAAAVIPSAKNIDSIGPSSSQNCHSAQSGSNVETATYRREDIDDNWKRSDTARNEDNGARFSENWIENLLRDGKCSESRVSSEGMEESAAAEEISNLSNGDKNILEYRAEASVANVNCEAIAEHDNQIDSRESNVQTGEEIIDKNQRSSPISNEVLPKWKAFRLLAMKDKTERCNICGTHFPDRNFLVLHKQLAHMIAEKDVNSMPEELLKNCPCHLCTKVFKTRGTLMVHMRVAHMGYNLGFLSKDREIEMSCCENGFNCPTCGKNFRKEQHVTQHLKTHEGKQWECDVCSKMFTTKYFLKKHKRLHSGEMPYKCTICDKTFTFQQSYHKHRLYHKDDKPHTCATCGRSFKELSTLHNHERIHTGEKPFACETCGKCFRQRVSYLVHRRIHTGVMPYKCTACGKNFRYKVSQRTHKCQAHPEESSPPLIENSLTSLQPQISSEIAAESNVLQPHRVVSEILPTESNKFILIVNTLGQQILTREADARTNDFSAEKQSTDTSSSVGNPKGNQNVENNFWSNHPPSRKISPRESCEASPNPEHKVNDKLRDEDTNDFFSLVMSPLEHDLSSPSTEMEHLRLESPGNEEIGPNESDEVNEITSNNNNLQRDLNNAIDGIFGENRSGNVPLETINEESLKQLLYGIDRKI